MPFAVWRTSLAAVTAVIVAFGLAGLLATAAWPRMHAPYRGHRIVPATAPLDGFTQPDAAYSLRRLKSAYTGPGIKLRRTTGGTQDIGYLGFTGFTGAPLDTAAAAAFCNAPCFLDTWYDQSGNARNATQATVATQPQYIADCGDGLPCLRSTGGSQFVQSASFSWAAGKTTLSVVGRRTAGTAARCYFAGKGQTLFGPATVANTWVVTDFVTEFTVAGVAEGGWHAGIAVVNGAGSLTNVDGTEAAGGNVAGTATGAFLLAYTDAAGVTCEAREAVVWDNYVLTTGERSGLVGNQKSFWGVP